MLLYSWLESCPGRSVWSAPTNRIRGGTTSSAGVSLLLNIRHFSHATILTFSSSSFISVFRFGRNLVMRRRVHLVARRRTTRFGNVQKVVAGFVIAFFSRYFIPGHHFLLVVGRCQRPGNAQLLRPHHRTGWRQWSTGCTWCTCR